MLKSCGHVGFKSSAMAFGDMPKRAPVDAATKKKLKAFPKWKDDLCKAHKEHKLPHDPSCLELSVFDTVLCEMASLKNTDHISQGHAELPKG